GRDWTTGGVAVASGRRGGEVMRRREGCEHRVLSPPGRARVARSPLPAGAPRERGRGEHAGGRLAGGCRLSSHALWFATRGFGVVSLLLLTAIVVLGVAGTTRWRRARWARLVVAGLHRNLTLH